VFEWALNEALTKHDQLIKVAKAESKMKSVTDKKKIHTKAYFKSGSFKG